MVKVVGQRNSINYRKRYLYCSRRLAVGNATRSKHWKWAWEVRSSIPNGIARVIFTMKNSEVVLLHGFIKKTQKTPDKELEIAKNRYKNLD